MPTSPVPSLDELVKLLREAHGGALRAVVLYGSAATGEYVAKRSDVNLLVLVDELPIERIEAEARAVRPWVAAGHPPPLTLTVAEWEASADVFPMEYADILARHRVLDGSPPFAGMAIDPADLRLQLEREARGKLIQLRQGLLATGGEPAREVELLARAFGTFMAIARGLLRLTGTEPPAEHAAVARAAAQRAGFDAAPFLAVLAHRRGERALEGAAIPGVVAGYLSGAERLAAFVDSHAAA